MDYPLGIVSPPEADPIRVFLRSREGTREGRKRIKKIKRERDVGCPRPLLKLTWETQPTENSSHKMLWSSEDKILLPPGGHTRRWLHIAWFHFHDQSPVRPGGSLGKPLRSQYQKSNGKNPRTSHLFFSRRSQHSYPVMQPLPLCFLQHFSILSSGAWPTRITGCGALHSHHSQSPHHKPINRK